MVQVIIHDNRNSDTKKQQRDFHHPYKPYDVQIQLMEAIYDTIDHDYKVGLFESPTGTGKTLSIICSTMSYLRQLKRDKNAMIDPLEHEDEDDDDDDDEPDWVKKVYRDKIISRLTLQAREYESHLDDLKKEGEKLITGKLKERQRRPVKRFKRSSNNKMENSNNDNDLIPDDYFSDDETKTKTKNGALNTEKYSKMNDEVQKLLQEVEGRSKLVDKSSSLNQCSTKIYFSSRTHSQLNQFTDQLRLTKFPSSFQGIDEKTKYLPMGSRKQLCINEKVSKIKDVQELNDTCLQLQKGSTDKKEETCPFFPNPNNEHDSELVTNFRDLSFSQVHDIEDLQDIGKHYNICPYYSSRKNVELAEIISLPYQLLLQKSTRDILNLSLKDSIVIIDEAHNLLDTISDLNSCSVSFNDLVTIRNALRTYTKRFSSKMNGGNRINLAKLFKLVTYLAKFMKKKIDLKQTKPGTEINPLDLFEGTTGDLLNIHSLEKYLNKSKIAFKLESYMERINNDNDNDIKNNKGEQTSRTNKKSLPLLFKIKSFLYCLSNPSKSGKLFFDKNENDDALMKYLLLDPSEAFKDIVDECKCVLLAGGTMEPITDFTNFLFPYLSDERINHFNCDHIIPDSNLNVYPIKAMGSFEFEFSFDKRNSKLLIENLGRSIIKIMDNVPFGVVVFFPSYTYLDQVLNHWKASGIFNQINKTKTVFTESKTSSAESVLQEYSTIIELENKGAILFSVVGGKMSEGINFSNDLARAVIMVGLPFPNVFSGDLIAKRKYIETTTLESGGTKQQAMAKAKDFYENICMKAVNQSVGRAIRNIDDYAVIYLIDSRYQRPSIQSKLSGWIRQRLLNQNNNIESASDATTRFFSFHNHKTHN